MDWPLSRSVPGIAEVKGFVFFSKCCSCFGGLWGFGVVGLRGFHFFVCLVGVLVPVLCLYLVLGRA